LKIDKCSKRKKKKLLNPFYAAMKKSKAQTTRRIKSLSAVPTESISSQSARNCAQARKRIIEASYKAGACHIGSALSCVEIIEALSRVKALDSRRFIFSKASGFLTYIVNITEESDLSSRVIKMKPLPSHFWRHLWEGGSLGQGLSVAAGIAMGTKENTYCLLSDGEMQEGQVWEAMMFAAHHKLPLIGIIDNNRLQALGSIDEIVSLEPLKAKCEAFGWDCVEVDGHDVEALVGALNAKKEKPLMVIANTVKGKGVSFMENNNDWHYKNLSKEKYEEAMVELNSSASSEG
jgi:transketolase